MWSHTSIFPHANAVTHSLSSGLKIDSLHAQNVFSLMIGPCLLTASSFSAFEVSHRVHFNLFQDCFSFAMQINAMWAANYWTVFRIKTQVTNSPFRLYFRFFFSWRKSRTRNSVPSKLIGRSLFAAFPLPHLLFSLTLKGKCVSHSFQRNAGNLALDSANSN